MTGIVAIGGGHGLSATLRAVRCITDDVTAVVSVADDGGSTGRLRRTTAQPAPGDLRKCLVALAEPDSLLARSMEFRFGDGELDGHAMGNLLLSAMTQVCGDLPRALEEMGVLLGVRGRVLPATTDPVDLVAVTVTGEKVEGQVAVMGTRSIDRVHLVPDPRPLPAAVEAIASADLVVLGPGSLYTSVLAAAVPLVEAIAAAPHVMYVCNLRPQDGETAGYGVAEHVAALVRHGIEPDVVLYDPCLSVGESGFEGGVAASLAQEDRPVHDPVLLAAEIRAQLARWAQNLIP